MSTDHTPTEFWEERYQEREAIWSGRPNQVLVDEVAGLPAGHALDLGCGEGADSIWLAEQGWRVTGVDISATALERAARQASALGVSDRITWRREDLSTWDPAATAEHYDLVSAQFLHSPVELPRDAILGRAAGAVAAGGVLIVVGHADAPPWATDVDKAHAPRFQTALETSDQLALQEPAWRLLVCENRRRSVTGPDGHPAELTDSVVVAERRGR